MTNIFITVGAAIISGLLGVVVTLIVQRRATVQQQKMAIFKTLLSNRHQLTAEANVSALNVIDVIFYKNDNESAHLGERKITFD